MCLQVYKRLDKYNLLHVRHMLEWVKLQRDAQRDQKTPAQTGSGSADAGTTDMRQQSAAVPFSWFDVNADLSAIARKKHGDMEADSKKPKTLLTFAMPQCERAWGDEVVRLLLDLRADLSVLAKEDDDDYSWPGDHWRELVTRVLAFASRYHC